MTLIARSFYIILFLSVLFLQSCAPPLYLPEVSNMPLPEKAKELKIEGGISTSRIYLQSTYSINNHFLIGGSMFQNSAFQFNNTYFGSLGGGYYKVLDSEITFESLVFAGAGKNTFTDSVKSFLNLSNSKI